MKAKRKAHQKFVADKTKETQIEIDASPNTYTRESAPVECCSEKDIKVFNF